MVRILSRHNPLGPHSRHRRNLLIKFHWGVWWLYRRNLLNHAENLSMNRCADSCTVPCHSGQQKASLYNLCSLATKHAQGGTEPNDDAYLQLWLKFAREQWYASGALFSLLPTFQ